MKYIRGTPVFSRSSMTTLHLASSGTSVVPRTASTTFQTASGRIRAATKTGRSGVSLRVLVVTGTFDVRVRRTVVPSSSPG